jgi:hypothetical protein
MMHSISQYIQDLTTTDGLCALNVIRQQPTFLSLPVCPLVVIHSPKQTASTVEDQVIHIRQQLVTVAIREAVVVYRFVFLINILFL